MEKSLREVAAESGIPRTTLQAYVSAGLIKPSIKENGYWYFDEGIMERLKLVQYCKALGFTYKQILEILNDPKADREQKVEEKLAAIAQEKARLETLLQDTQMKRRLIEF